MPPSRGAITAIIVAVVSIFYASHVSLHSVLCHSLCSTRCQTSLTNSASERSKKPHHSSWNAWWHPRRSRTEVEQGAGTTTEDWNILYHLGGNGPWVEKIIDVVDGGIAPPDGCEVVQVHMVCHRDFDPSAQVAKV